MNSVCIDAETLIQRARCPPIGKDTPPIHATHPDTMGPCDWNFHEFSATPHELSIGKDKQDCDQFSRTNDGRTLPCGWVQVASANKEAHEQKHDLTYQRKFDPVKITVEQCADEGHLAQGSENDENSKEQVALFLFLNMFF